MTGGGVVAGEFVDRVVVGAGVGTGVVVGLTISVCFPSTQ